MEKEALKNIFDFLEKNENKKNKNKATLKWKLFFNESLTKEELNVSGNLHLANLKITSLPEGLKVGGSLDLTNCINLKSLPEGLKVGGSLYLKNCSNLTSLPEGLEVRGALSLSNCTSLTSLPEGLKVGGSLELQYCKNLTSLPKGLKVGWELKISGTKLKKYTDDELKEMIKPGFIKGEIYTEDE